MCYGINFWATFLKEKRLLKDGIGKHLTFGDISVCINCDKGNSQN